MCRKEVKKIPGYHKKLKHPRQYTDLHEKIPWAGAKKNCNITGRYEFKDLPKWLEFLDKWEGKKRHTT